MLIASNKLLVLHLIITLFWNHENKINISATLRGKQLKSAVLRDVTVLFYGSRAENHLRRQAEDVKCAWFTLAGAYIRAALRRGLIWSQKGQKLSSAARNSSSYLILLHLLETSLYFRPLPFHLPSLFPVTLSLQLFNLFSFFFYEVHIYCPPRVGVGVSSVRQWTGCYQHSLQKQSPGLIHNRTEIKGISLMCSGVSVKFGGAVSCADVQQETWLQLSEDELEACLTNAARFNISFRLLLRCCSGSIFRGPSKTSFTFEKEIWSWQSTASF